MIGNNGDDTSFVLPVKIYITSTPSGFACGIENEDTYHAAKAFAESVAKGEVKVKHEDENLDSGDKTPY